MCSTQQKLLGIVASVTRGVVEWKEVKLRHGNEIQGSKNRSDLNIDNTHLRQCVAGEASIKHK